MKKVYKISVIIPVYNADRYLEKCLESVINQSFKSIEIICINDGSTDNSPKILNDFSQRYNNVKVFNQKNQGIISARIQGLKNASGKYIGWVDSDDFIEKNMFEKLYMLAIKNKCEVAMCDYNFFPNNFIKKKKWFKKYEGKIDYKFIANNTIQWNKIVKKSLLDKINIVELFEKLGEGAYSLVLINAKNIVSTSECLYNYRVGHLSLSNNYKNTDWYLKTINRAFNKFNYVKVRNYDLKWQEYFYYVYLYYNLVYIIISAYNNDYKNYKKYTKFIKNEKLFSRKYRKYLSQDLSYIKILGMKIIGINSYYFLKNITKISLK